jgi:16S rRNA G966 N2-methylase RsmD
MKPVKSPFNEAVVAKTHPPLYLMHKYWARKPHNVVARYIEYYTNPGDVVLDPFMGSGVTVIEAGRLGRKAIGNDLNPIACFITRMTLVPIDLAKLQDAFFRIEADVREKIDSYYKVICSNPKCGKDAITTHVVWRQDKFKDEKMFLLRATCPHCSGKEQRKPTDDDLQRYETLLAEPVPYFYPKDIKLHATAKRSVEFIHELFTHRALICLSILWHAIQKERDDGLRCSMAFLFTSALAQTTRLIPFVLGGTACKSWTIPNYWVPATHFEINVWNCFLERYKKFKRGKAKQTPSFNSAILNEDATALKSIRSNSVDYIFTDPPYGDAVPYFGLSLMWAAWLGCDKELDFDHEVIISERGDYEKELEDYRKRLKESFREMFRVLKNNGTVTVTFHNREIRVWNALVAAAFEAGFVYENDNYVLPPWVSAKSLLAKSGSMTGDIYINFRKPPKVELQGEFTFEEAKRVVTEEVKMIIQSRNGQATTDQLSRGIYSQLIKRNLFNKLPSTDVRELLWSLPIREVMPNVWSLPKREAESMLAYIPLHKRIEFIVDGVLERNHKHGLELDDFLVPIFTQLKNGLTPDNKEILEVLRQRAEVKRDKWYPLRERQIELLPEYELPKKAVLPEEELREHEQFIYQLARLGATLGYQVWVGNNEQNKSELLQNLSLVRLEIPGLSDKFIANNRIDQIDLIWLNPDEARYAAFEIENSTGVVPGIQRLANLTGKLEHVKIPTYIVIPDKFRGMAQKIFDSPSGRMLGSKQRRVIVYSKLLHYIDLLNRKMIRPSDLLASISEPA